MFGGFFAVILVSDWSHVRRMHTQGNKWAQIIKCLKHYYIINIALWKIWQKAGRKEGNYLFKDTLNKFYLRLCCVGHMIKDHSDSERENPMQPLHGLLFLLAARVLFIHHPTDRTTHTTAFVTPIMEHWLEWELAQWVHHEGLIWRPITSWADDLLWSYISLKRPSGS